MELKCKLICQYLDGETMNRQKSITLSVLLIFSLLLLPACGTVGQTLKNSTGLLAQSNPNVAATSTATAPASTATVQPAVNTDNTTTGTTALSGSTNQAELLSAYEGTLENIYANVSPSIVYIDVVSVASSNSSLQPFLFGNPNDLNRQGQQLQEGTGSGFVWDTQGHIVTNYHVVENAKTVKVTFTDGVTVTADVVGTDSYSDLAVIKVDPSGLDLKPVAIADSTQVKVGQMAVAIGNPYGLESTMTVGIISALGRSLSAGKTMVNGSSYSIPDIIQTDAAINPGNSGGALLNVQGQLIGVTSAIESSSGSNAGIGFAIPSAIVSRVIPQLLSTGTYDHPYLGISGMTLTPELAKAMGLKATQRGALVQEVTSGGPSDKAGLHGSTKEITIDGQSVNIGGDIIIAIDGKTVKEMDDIISYLANSTNVGQKVTLTIIRNGKEQKIDVTLGKRPADQTTEEQSALGNNNGNNGSGDQALDHPYLGVGVVMMDSTIAKAMNLPDNQGGLLVEKVDTTGPAGQAGLKAGTQTIDDNGRQVVVGGDVILSVNGQEINDVASLRSVINNAQPGDEITITILRDGKQQDLKVTLGSQPTSMP